jgi:hypothetical protein
MSNLSYFSSSWALNLVGAEIQNSLEEIKMCVQDVNQSIKDIATSNLHKSLLFTEKCKPCSNVGHKNNDDDLASKEAPSHRSKCFVEFDTQQLDGTCTFCKIIPLQDFYHVWEKHEPARTYSISVDPFASLWMENVFTYM